MIPYLAKIISLLHEICPDPEYVTPGQSRIYQTPGAAQEQYQMDDSADQASPVPQFQSTPKQDIQIDTFSVNTTESKLEKKRIKDEKKDEIRKQLEAKRAELLQIQKENEQARVEQEL